MLMKMKYLLLLLLLALPVQAANFLYSENRQSFYRADPAISKLVIDSTFSEDFKSIIENDVKKYYDITEVEIKSIRSNYRERGALPIVNYNDENFSWCNCGGYFWARALDYVDDDMSFSFEPIIVVPNGNRGTLLEEIGHSLGLDEESPKTGFIRKGKKGKKKWIENDLTVTGADQIMSYGMEPMLHGFEPSPSDEFTFNLQTGKVKDYFTLTSNNLLDYNGADIFFQSNKKTRAVVNFNHDEIRDGYLSAIGYLEDGEFSINLPTDKAFYDVYIMPRTGGDEVPNPEDVSGLTKPMLIGKVRVSGNGHLKLSKSLRRKYGFIVK